MSDTDSDICNICDEIKIDNNSNMNVEIDTEVDIEINTIINMEMSNSGDEGRGGGEGGGDGGGEGGIVDVDIDLDIMEASMEGSDIVLNPNETIEDIFQNEVACAIDSGNVNIIKRAINNFGHLLDSSYIEWANQVIFEIVEDQFDELDL